MPIQAGDIDTAEDVPVDYMFANDLIQIEQVENASVTAIFDDWPTVLFKD